MPLIASLSATSELEAVNSMLAAIAEAPITDLTAGQDLTDVQMATSELRKAAREVQVLPWKFNTRFQVPLSPAGTTAWTDPNGTTNTLNVFTPPSGLASFTVSEISSQIVGGNVLDLAIMPSVVYTPGTLVFVDRTYNRDGLVQATYPRLYIDATYWYDFEKLPESARRYITVLAGRRFIQSVLGSSEISGFLKEDVALALRALKLDQGSADKFNMFDSPDVARFFGSRPRMTGPFVDYRRGY